MLVVTKYKFGGVQTCLLPDDAGTTTSCFDEKSGKSTEASSLETDGPSFRSCWIDKAGNIVVARRAMRDRDAATEEERLRVNATPDSQPADPTAPYTVVPAAMVPDVEYVEVDGVTIYGENPAAQTRVDGKQAVDQFRRHTLDMQAGAPRSRQFH